MHRFAEVHPGSELRPSKLELLAAWLPSQSWFTGDASGIERAAAYRLVDPDGEVGLDGMLISTGDAVFHVPVTWRAAPLEDGALIGTLHHSALGERWCYDAETDPVVVAEATRVIVEGDGEAEIRAASTGEVLPGTMRLRGSGSGGDAAGGDGGGEPRLVVLRALSGDHGADAGDGLIGFVDGTWEHDGRERTERLIELR